MASPTVVALQSDTLKQFSLSQLQPLWQFIAEKIEQALADELIQVVIKYSAPEFHELCNSQRIQWTVKEALATSYQGSTLCCCAVYLRIVEKSFWLQAR